MISLDRVRELLGEPAMSDAEAEAISDACRTWAELAIIALRNQNTKAVRANDSRQEKRAEARLLDSANRDRPRI